MDSEAGVFGVARVLSALSRPTFPPLPTVESLNTRPTPLSLIDLRKTTPIQFSALLLGWRARAESESA